MYLTIFNPTIEVVTLSLRGWYVLAVFVAGIHTSMTLMNFEGSRPEWCILIMIYLYSKDTPFWSETFDLSFVQSKPKYLQKSLISGRAAKKF